MDSEKSEVYRALGPVLIVSEVYGLNFLSSRSPKVQFFHKSVIFSLLIGSLILQIPVITYWIRCNTTDLDSFLQLAKITIAWTNYFVNFITTAWNHTKIELLLKKLSLIEIQLEKRSESRIFRKLLSTVIANFLVILGFQFLGVYLTPKVVRDYFSAFIYIFVEILSVTVTLQFVAVVLLLKECFKCLNNKINQFQGKVDQNISFPFKQAKEITLLRTTHFDLCDTNRQWLKAYQLQLLLSIIKCFTEVTFWISSLVEEEKSYLQFVLCFLVSGFNLLIITNICYTCQLALEEARKTGREIYQVINSTNNENIREEFRTFSLQMFHKKLVHSVMGFFHLNLKLLQEMVAAVTSYITIIYTFSISRGS